MNAWMKSLTVAAMAMTASVVVADETIVMDGSTTVGPIAKAFAEYYMKNNPGVNVTVGESGSGNGAKSLVNGTCQIANMSRPMKEGEIEACTAKGVNPVVHIVAMDGLTPVVHPSNPVENLTRSELKQIYMGEITNWKELGGPNQKIVVISRDTNSGTYESWETLVMKADRITDKAEYVGSNGAIRQRVLGTPNAIGYVGLAFVEGVKQVAVDGVMATPETVLDRTFPIARPLHMYTNGEPAPGSHLEKLVNLYKTDDGKQMIEETGFVPVE